MMSSPPAHHTPPNQFDEYLVLVPEPDTIKALKSQDAFINSLAEVISEEHSLYAYAPNKWSIREMLQHIIDTERIFAYRALCIARGEGQSLPGFDENAYAGNSNANSRSWSSLCAEMKVVRNSTLMLFESFDEAMRERSGLANGKSVTPAIIGKLIAGHFAHHRNVLAERYNVSL